MSSTDFDAWIEAMGLSEYEVAERLGCSRTSVKTWRHRKAPPLYIGLACAAVARKLSPRRPR
jgi:transposase